MKLAVRNSRKLAKRQIWPTQNKLYSPSNMPEKVGKKKIPFKIAYPLVKDRRR
jgi:hypothetical protein